MLTNLYSHLCHGCRSAGSQGTVPGAWAGGPVPGSWFGLCHCRSAPDVGKHLLTYQPIPGASAAPASQAVQFLQQATQQQTLNKSLLKVTSMLDKSELSLPVPCS